MEKLLAWIQASRLMSQLYILLPLLFGQGLYVRQTNKWSYELLIITICYSFLIQLYIVYANDYADEAVDEINDTYNVFSGGSRVLVEKKLTRLELRRGLILVMVLSALLAVLTGIVYARIGVIFCLLFSWALLWAYSFPPIRLSYRGGGEWLQAFGVGVLLPVTGYYFQAGTLNQFPWIVLPFTLLLHLGAALVTTLPDEPSDRTGKKMTLAAREGRTGVIRWAIILYGLSFCLVFGWICLFSEYPKFYMLITLPALLIYMGLFRFRSKAIPGSTDMNAFVALGVATTILMMAGLSVVVWFFPRHFIFR